MKKNCLYILFLLFSTYFAGAQTTTITGTVKDKQGNALHFAFVQDNQKHSTYTDSTGSFNVEANANATLAVNCAGYRDTTIAVNGRNNLEIVLSLSGTGQGTEVSNVSGEASTESMRNTFRGVISQQNENSGIYSTAGTVLPTFNPKEETEGSRYLIKGWAHGYVVTSKDSTVQNSGFLYDYDKMGGGLLLTKDKKSAIEINRDIVKSFTLFDNANEAYKFANVPQISTTHYVQVLASGSKYNIYKAIKTTFEKANFTTDGVLTQGHNFDLYKDEYTYYVLDVKTNTLQEIALKKKSLKLAFAKEADKINKYLFENSNTIDDFYLTNLGATMNE
jgi:hypothetical protein